MIIDVLVVMEVQDDGISPVPSSSSSSSHATPQSHSSMGPSAVGQGLGGGATRTFGKHTYTAAKSTGTTTTNADGVATTRVSPSRSSGVTPGKPS